VAGIPGRMGDSTYRCGSLGEPVATSMLVMRSGNFLEALNFDEKPYNQIEKPELWYRWTHCSAQPSFDRNWGNRFRSGRIS